MMSTAATEKSFIVPSDRVAPFKPYFFATLNQKIAALKDTGLDIIRLDMGSPDLPPRQFIIDALTKSANQATTHGYAPNEGSPAYRKAIVHYYAQRFGVEIDLTHETLGLLGSKEGLFNLAQVLLNPGDVVIVPDPGYPVYTAGAQVAGAEIYYIPLLEENGFLPDLDSIPADILQRAKLMWINYPNNPTGAVAPFEFFEKIVAFGRNNHIVIAHDAPYVDVCFNGYDAPSIMQVPGAKDVAVEFNSLSKTYNMAGWRLGMVVGNAQVIRYLHTYKSQVDSSHFTAMQEAAAAALTGDQGWLVERNAIYQERRDLVVDGLKNAGFKVSIPPASIYVWARLPEGVTDCYAYCDQLLEQTGVSITPGAVYGNYGGDYVRISLVTPTNRIQEAMQRLKRWSQEKQK